MAKKLLDPFEDDMYEPKTFDIYEQYEKKKQAKIDKNTLAPYEKKATKLERTGGGGAGAGAGANPMKTGILSPFNMKKGGKVSSASKRADGIATKGKTRGRMV